MDTQSAGQKHILVIDDDMTSLDIVSFFFERRGYGVDRCADGESALNYIRSHVPDLAIVDLMMPGINGVDTIREIRKLGFSEMPILAFTAVDDPALHRRALDAGCNDVLTKPCPTEKLLRHIRSLLGEEQ